MERWERDAGVRKAERRELQKSRGLRIPLRLKTSDSARNVSITNTQHTEMLTAGSSETITLGKALRCW